MSKVLAIALTTFRELIRSKILYGVLFFAAALVLVVALFGSVTIGDQILVIKDFGLFSISLFSAVFTIIAGAALLHKELSKKTIYNILSKPVPRPVFLWGKFAGMLAVIGVIIALMGTALIFFVYMLSGKLDVLLAYACLYIFLELTILCAAAIFFSSLVVTPVLSGFFTLSIFLAGRSIDYLLYFVKEGVLSEQSAMVLRFLHAVLPNLRALNVSADAAFGDWAIFSIQHLTWSAVYALSYTIILLILAGVLFERKEFN